MISTGFITFTKREIYRFLVLYKQTIIPGLLSSFLYIIVFGNALGKKINLDNDTASSNIQELFWGDVNDNGIPNEPGIEVSPVGSHWRVYWDAAGTSPGSSGSGLFNDEKLLVGQLSGGNNDCIDPIEPSDCDRCTQRPLGLASGVQKKHK